MQNVNSELLRNVEQYFVLCLCVVAAGFGSDKTGLGRNSLGLAARAVGLVLGKSYADEWKEFSRKLPINPGIKLKQISHNYLLQLRPGLMNQVVSGRG